MRTPRVKNSLVASALRTRFLSALDPPSDITSSQVKHEYASLAVLSSFDLTYSSLAAAQPVALQLDSILWNAIAIESRSAKEMLLAAPSVWDRYTKLRAQSGWWREEDSPSQ